MIEGIFGFTSVIGVKVIKNNNHMFTWLLFIQHIGDGLGTLLSILDELKLDFFRLTVGFDDIEGIILPLRGGEDDVFGTV